ncbi:Gfo/Idh/MocA family oxidoreductase [Rhodococcus erythropolis]|uniref:Gfo/Idh/MocA family protein n=1 Tax=Rhodococcus erythropolis TaxID=1833 RepID=UPI00294A4D11|nr:Gfo/Idh/MocA family oxidoreductase [Rhodococcus erythropolis]MDV6212653.1 Gfo/Idh/MocA family oxidoreductase [Rhodococcus erythropolis]
MTVDPNTGGRAWPDANIGRTTGSGSDRRVGTVVLGASHWHVPLYRDAIGRRHRVLSVQDDNLVAASEFAQFWCAPSTTSVDTALDREDIELAYVFSPHDEMAAVTGKLIDRGIAFVVEKPAGVDLAEVTVIADAARLAGVPATVALVQRNAPVETWLRRAGDIVYERFSFIAGPPGRYRESGNAWMLDPLRSGGGCLTNLGPHFVDLALRHIGHAAEASVRLSSALHHDATEDHATVVLSNEGREAIVEVGYAFPGSPLKRYCSFSAAGTNGFASIDTTGSALFTDKAGNTIEAEIDVDSDPLYERFVDNVADSLDTNFLGMPTLDEFVQSMAIIWPQTPQRLSTGE